MSERGRYPFYLDIIKAMLKYWHRLENLDRNSLLYDALECLKIWKNVGLKQSSFIKKLANVLKQKY